jgi:hypothetical protein
MPLAPQLTLLLQLADAYATPNPGTGKREPIDLFRAMGGPTFQHRALPPEFDVDEEWLWRLEEQGYVRIERRRGLDRVSVTAHGEDLALKLRRLDDESEPAPGDAISLDWEAVARPTLEATYRAWLARGAPAEGISIATVVRARERPSRDPETYRAVALLHQGGYLDQISDLIVDNAPGLVAVSAQGLEVVGGWPSTTAEAASKALLAALDQEIAATDEPEEKGRLVRLREAAVEVGTGTLTQVLAHIVKGSLS